MEKILKEDDLQTLDGMSDEGISLLPIYNNEGICVYSEVWTNCNGQYGECADGSEYLGRTESVDDSEYLGKD